MAARDIYHNTVIAALVKDGWKITDDPLSIKWGQKVSSPKSLVTQEQGYAAEYGRLTKGFHLERYAA